MSTKPARLDISVYQGATFFRRFTWTDKRNPVSLTGYTFHMQIRPTVDSDEIIADLSTSNGNIVVEDAVNGIFTIEIPHTDTEAMAHSSGVYDVEAIDSAGRVSRILFGNVEIVPGVTR